MGDCCLYLVGVWEGFLLGLSVVSQRLRVGMVMVVELRGFLVRDCLGVSESCPLLLTC